MTVDVPLINDYKKNFIFRRLFQTFLGGLCIPPKNVFCVSICLQIVIYIIPSIIHIITELIAEGGFQEIIVGVSNVVFFGLTATLFYVLGNRKCNNQINEDGRPTYFLIPKKQKLNIIIHALIAGLYSCWIYSFLLKDYVIKLFPHHASLILFFAWFSSLNASFSLLVGNNPETSIFRPLDQFEISCISRPLVAVIISLPQRIFPFYSMDQISYIIFCCLPLFWITGMIPTVEPLLLWMGEQIQIHAFGGTATSSWPRFIIYLVLSSLEFVIIYLNMKNDPKWTFVLASIIGFILSLDILGVIISLTQCISKKISSKIFPVSSYKIKAIKKLIAWKEYSVFFLLLILTIAFSFIDITSNQQRAGIILHYLGWTNILLTCILGMVNSVDDVFMFFGILRSPFYFSKPSFSTISIKDDKESILKIVIRHIRNILIKYLLPIYLLTYLKILFFLKYDKETMENMVSKIFKAIGLIRILRYIWQYTGFALSELAIYHLYTFFNLKKGIPIKLNVFTELLIIGFLRDRLVLLSKKLYFVAVCSVSSLEERASKRSYAGCLFQLNILISPFLLCLAIISSILQCPLYAFFSLPIFGIAYPRSRRFWPDAPTHSSSDSDAIYYEQMHDSFLTSLHSKLNCGKLYPYEPGDHFLARYEDKILWTTVLECGNGYAYYRVKGTELQHTSCHSLEATRIDDIFRIAFEEDKPSLFNRFAFHCLTPIGSIEVKTYSDTKNVLTGIIEASDTLKLVAELYLKTLIWYLLKYLKETGKSHSNESANKISGGVFIRSESVEAINLDSWPPSNESTWVETLRQSAYIKTHKPTFVDDDAIDEVSDFEIDDLPLTPSKRKGLLPPILNEEIGSSKNNRNSEESIILQLENIFIPGGIENQSRVPKKEINGNFTSITPPKTPIQISFTQSKDLPIPPMDWLHFPSLSSIRREEIYSDIDEEWLSLILYNFFEFQEDQVNYNLDCYKHVLCGCFGSIYESNVDITSKGPNLFVNAFHSRFTNLILPDNLISKIITPAFKCAIKLALDEKIFYNNISDSKEDLIEAIKEIDNNWYLGNESELKWNDSIIKEVPHLFSLKGVEGRSKNTLYRSRLLSLQIANVYVGKLNSELVHGLWASLNLELLYLTNDDDERYSIQAEERLLRNLTVQVADPPLGYAIFTSSPLRKSID